MRTRHTRLAAQENLSATSPSRTHAPLELQTPPSDEGTPYATACLKDSAYSAIRDAILTGRYSPGMQLKEVSLAKEMRLSRTPVRHALAKLAAEGLVAEVPHVGMFVRKLSRAEVVELVGLRRVMESGAAALAAGRATPTECDELRKMAARLDQLFSQRSRPEVEELELGFHRRIVEMAGNKEVERIFLNAQRFFFTLAIHPESGERPRADGGMPTTHLEVADAIAGRDPSKAFRAMWDHVSVVKSYL